MTDEEKLYGAYYQPERIWTGGKATKEPGKITFMSRKDIRSWLAKQAFWQVHIPPLKEVHHPHNDVTKPNEQHQFDLLYMPHNVFEGNTYKYIFTGIDVASSYKVARPLRTKKSSEVAFVLEAIYKKDGMFKYPKAFQWDNGPEQGQVILTQSCFFWKKIQMTIKKAWYICLIIWSDASNVQCKNKLTL